MNFYLQKRPGIAQSTICYGGAQTAVNLIPPPLSIPLPTPDQMAQVGILPQKRPKPQLTVPRKKVKIEQKTL